MKSLPEESYFLIRCWWLCIDIHIQKGLQAMGYYDFIPIMWGGSTMQNCVMSSLQREGWAEAQPSWLILQGQIQLYNPLIQNTEDKPTNYFCLSRSNSALSHPGWREWASLLGKLQDVFSCDWNESQSVSWGLSADKNRNKIYQLANLGI